MSQVCQNRSLAIQKSYMSQVCQNRSLAMQDIVLVWGENTFNCVSASITHFCKHDCQHHTATSVIFQNCLQATTVSTKPPYCRLYL